MADDARTRIGALSGGQRRRVDLGIAIIGRPEMLFPDEPTTGLDPEARRRLWAVIENLTAGGTTILLTTHYLDELRAMGGAPVIRYRLPVPSPGCTTPELAAELAEHVTDGELFPLASRGSVVNTSAAPCATLELRPRRA